MTKPYDIQIAFERWDIDLGKLIPEIDDLRLWHEIHSAYSRVTSLAKELPLFAQEVDVIAPVAAELQGLLRGITKYEDLPMLSVDPEPEEPYLNGLKFKVFPHNRYPSYGDPIVEGDTPILEAVTLDGSHMRIWGSEIVHIPYMSGTLPTPVGVEATIQLICPESPFYDWMSAPHEGVLTVQDLDYDEWAAVPNDMTDEILDGFFVRTSPA